MLHAVEHFSKLRLQSHLENCFQNDPFRYHSKSNPDFIRCILLYDNSPRTEQTQILETIK